MPWKDCPRQAGNGRNSRALEMTVHIRSEMPVDPLVLEGWERQNTLDEPRLSEVAEMYRETGFEVRFEQFDPEQRIRMHGMYEGICGKIQDHLYTENKG